MVFLIVALAPTAECRSRHKVSVLSEPRLTSFFSRAHCWLAPQRCRSSTQFACDQRDDLGSYATEAKRHTHGSQASGCYCTVNAPHVVLPSRPCRSPLHSPRSLLSSFRTRARASRRELQSTIRAARTRVLSGLIQGHRGLDIGSSFPGGPFSGIAVQ